MEVYTVNTAITICIYVSIVFRANAFQAENTCLPACETKCVGGVKAASKVETFKTKCRIYNEDTRLLHPLNKL